ncbi:MAG: hypothetical protein WCX08_05135 [Candidatus Buchananbacteria bacterium]
MSTETRGVDPNEMMGVNSSENEFLIKALQAFDSALGRLNNAGQDKSTDEYHEAKRNMELAFDNFCAAIGEEPLYGLGFVQIYDRLDELSEDQKSMFPNILAREKKSREKE